MLTFPSEQCICALFMDPQISLFSNFFIKNGSHGTIYTFKNYFATVFSVFNFSKISPIQTDPYCHSNWGFRVYKNLNLGKRLHTWETWREMWKKLSSALIDFEEGCFGFLNLFHLSKMHVLVMRNSIPLNITAKVISGCKVWLVW